MSKTATGGRVAYADLLRVVAMLAVIVVHLAGSRLGNVAVGSAEFHILNAYDGLTHWCVPVFIMLSGMFLLDPNHSLPPSKLVFGHILRILIALAVWGTAYALVTQALAAGLSWAAVKTALYQVLLGKTHFHLWFLYMIVGLYLVTPILRAFVRGAGRAEFHWFLLLAFLFASLLPTLLRLRPSQTMSLWVDNLDLHLVLGYVGYYVLGYYLKTFPLNRAAELLIYLLGVLGAAATVGGTAWLSQQRGQLIQTLYNYDSANVVLMSVAVFVFFRRILGAREKEHQWVSGVAKVSFGVYLVHVFCLMALDQLNISVLSITPLLAVPLLTAAVFACSFVVAWLISKLPLVGRYLT